MPDESLVRFRRVVSAAMAELESRRQEVNDLNVFPVADGDTGDNMALTMRAVVEELAELDDSAMERIGRDEIVSAVARAARGADAASASVRAPAEGTMLTAVRAMASRVAHDLAHMDTQRLGPEATAQEQDELLAQVLENALEAGKEAVARGPEQLAVLRESGVVDAGAYGLTVIIAGCLAALRGAAAPQLEHQYAPAALHRPEHESSSYRYCTNFAVTGQGLDAGRVTPELEKLGDSVLVVGDDRTLRVHVHTDAPDAAVALFEPLGDVSRFDVADMHEQVADRSARLAREAGAAEQSTSAVVAGGGGRGGEPGLHG